MAFHLDYVDTDGQVRKRQFSSYYECVVEKNKLRKSGVEVKYSESGVDVSRSYEIRRVSRNEKDAIKSFLARCEKIGDLRNAKNCDRIAKRNKK